MTITSALATAVDFACGIGLDETTRLAGRRGQREFIAKLRAELAPIDEDRELTRRLESQKDTHDAEHSAAVAPILERLAFATDPVERLDLRQKQANLNADLEVKLRSLDSQIRALNKDGGARRAQIVGTISIATLELAKRKLASPRLWRLKVAADGKVEWTRKRKLAAEAWVERIKSRLVDLTDETRRTGQKYDLTTLEEQLADQRVELEAATAELATAEQEVAELHSKILAE